MFYQAFFELVFNSSEQQVLPLAPWPRPEGYCEHHVQWTHRHPEKKTLLLSRLGRRSHPSLPEPPSLACRQWHMNGSSELSWGNNRSSQRMSPQQLSGWIWCSPHSLSSWSSLSPGRTPSRRSGPNIIEYQRNGWRPRCHLMEVGCRGFAGQPLCRAHNMLGITGARKQKPSKRPLKQQKMLQGGCGSGGEICGWGQCYLDTSQGLIILGWVAWTRIATEQRRRRLVPQHVFGFQSILSRGSKDSCNVLANISIKTLKIKPCSKICMYSSLRAQKVLKLRSTNAWRMLNICMTNCRGGQTSSWSLILKWVKLSEENVLFFFFTSHLCHVWIRV